MQIKDAYEKIAQCKSELNAAKCVRHNRQGNLKLLHWLMIMVQLSRLNINSRYINYKLVLFIVTNYNSIECFVTLTSTRKGICIATSSSAMAEGPRNAVVSRNSVTTKHPI